MKKVILSLVSVMTVLMFVSCGSKPKAEEETPVAPIEEIIEEQIEEQVSEVVDNDATIALIDNARNLAIEAGAEEKAPELLKAIDDYYNQIKEGTINPAESAELIARYKALASYIKASEAKAEIDEKGYASYYQSAYDDGVKALERVEAAFNNSENAVEYVADADGAYANFMLVLNAAYKKLAKEEREAAYEAKKQADSVKAAVSRNAEYKEATTNFQNGDSLYAMQNAKKAYENYNKAKVTYTTLYNEIYEKRAAAQAAIEAAKKRVEESALFALEADSKAPITEKVEGIEDEDAVLLEEDTYQNPEDAEIDVAETIEEAMIEKAVDLVNTVVNDAK